MGMSGTAVTASCGIDSCSELDDVFLHFYRRLVGIPDTQRSVAQGAIPREDIDGLAEWLKKLYGKPRMWCDDPWQNSVAGVGTVSNQEMFGALLIILATEVCRDKSSEEELWPAVVAVLEKDTITFPLLFDANRQPGALCKKAMAGVPAALTSATLLTAPEGKSMSIQSGFSLALPFEERERGFRTGWQD